MVRRSGAGVRVPRPALVRGVPRTEPASGTYSIRRVSEPTTYKWGKRTQGRAAEKRVELFR